MPTKTIYLSDLPVTNGTVLLKLLLETHIELKNFVAVMKNIPDMEPEYFNVASEIVDKKQLMEIASTILRHFIQTKEIFMTYKNISFKYDQKNQSIILKYE